MARRTMAVHTLKFNVTRRRESAAPSDLGGENIGDVFHDWCANLMGSDALVDRETGHFIQITAVDRQNSRGFILVTTQVGSWGDPGLIMNTTTLAPSGALSADEAATAYCRTAMFVPDRGEAAYLFTEYVDRGNGGGRLYELFRSYFADTHPFTMRRQAVLEARTWAEAATLQAVKVRVVNYSGDKADPKSKIIGTVMHIFTPKKREFFPADILAQIQRDKGAALKLVQLEELPDDRERRAEILVEVSSSVTGHKQSRTFAVGDEWGTPAVREVLCDHGAMMLDNDSFLYRCEERLRELGVTP